MIPKADRKPAKSGEDSSYMFKFYLYRSEDEQLHFGLAGDSLELTVSSQLVKLN